MWHKSTMCIAIIFGLFAFGQMSAFAQTTTSDDAYCQSISICGSAPQEFNMMLSFVQELINTIRTVGTEGDYLGKYVNPNWFVGTKFSPPDKNIIGKTWDDVKQKFNFGIATTAILVSPQQLWGLTDFFAGIATLFRNTVFSRDLQRLEALDSSITQKKYEIGLGWWWIEDIRAENIVLLQKVIDTYKVKWLLTQDSMIPTNNSIKYSDVTAMASNLVAGLKLFLAGDSTETLFNLSTSTMVINFKPEIIPSLQRQYDCAKWAQDICDPAYKNFSTTMDTTTKSATARITTALKIFADATQRLKEAFDPNNQSEYAAKESQLLTSYNGNQKASSGISFSMDNGSAFTNRRSTTVQAQTQNTNIIDQTRTNSNTSVAPITVQKDFDAWMRDRMTPLMAQQNVDLSLVNFSEVKDYSSYFNQLGELLNNIKKLIGTKDSDGLIKELGQACQLQCWWIAKKCYSD